MLTRIFRDSTHWTGIFLVLTLLISSAAHAKPGDLDPSFGISGKQTIDVNNIYSGRVIVQPDGKFLVNGEIKNNNTGNASIFVSQDLFSARYNSDGRLDSTFDSGGKLIFPGIAQVVLTDTVTQPDGKIVAVGGAGSLSGLFVRDSNLTLVRYNADATLDKNFGNAGVVTTSFEGSDVFSDISEVTIQTDGKIMALGTMSPQPPSPAASAVLARYNSDGSLDMSFGNGGKLTTKLGEYDRATSLMIQPDGKIVVAGITPNPANPGPFVIRYNSNGTLDSSFVSQGRLTLSSDPYGGPALLPDGKIQVNSGSEVVRYRSDGSLDSSFGNNGRITAPSGTIQLIFVEAGGKILVETVEVVNSEKYVHSLLRYQSNGALDTHFGEGGKLTLPTIKFADNSNKTSSITSLGQQSDGKIVAVGVDYITDVNGFYRGDIDASLIRYLGDSGLPQPGWWWNLIQSGRGFTIEVQGDHLYFAGYLYDASGRATWYTSGGSMTNNTSYTGTLYSFANGQTLAGNYKAPIPSVVGIINLQFTDATHGTLTWPGGTLPIERYVFGAGTASFQPENGWRWNEAESGRGFTIEVQGNTLFMSGYMYDDSGNPVWYVSSGGINSTLYQGQWLQYANGQTLTGPYKFPDPPVNAGNVVLEFTSRTNAMLTLPNGKQIALSRFRF